MNHKKVCFEELFPLIEEKMKAGESFSFLAFGTSMLPFLRNGKDVVTLSPCSKKIKKNDVIFYRRKTGQFVLHRVVKVLESGELWLCGDNQFSIEKGIFPQQVIGILVKIERDGKSLHLSSFGQKIYLFLLNTRRNIHLFLHKIKKQMMRILK